MVECQYHGEPSTENYVKEKNKEDFEKNIVISTVDMVMDEGTFHGLEQGSKVRGHVRVVGEDNGVHTNVEPDAKDEEWHQAKHKIKGKGVATQKDTKCTNGNTLLKDNLRMNEGFEKNPWQKNTCEIKDCLANHNSIL